MKTVLITGATGGLGSELCKKMLVEGHQVFALVRSVQKFDEQFKTEKNNPRLNIIHADLKNIEIEYFTELWKKNLGNQKVDILINNAGLLICKPFEMFKINDIQSLLKVNFLAPALIIQSLMMYFAKPSHIVNITSMGAVQGSMKFPGLTFYGATKSALQNLTETLAVELKEHDISINALSLGAVQTPMLESAFPHITGAISPQTMIEFVTDFALKGHLYFNGKILPVSTSTP